MQQSLNITVVGGSIAGCAAAVELASAGHRVAVYERVAGALSGRGIGIGIEAATLIQLTEHGLIDPDLSRVDAPVVRYVHRSPSGHTTLIGEVGQPAALVHWSALYHALRGRVPDADCHDGHEVTLVGPAEAGALDLDTDHDLVVFADGFRSIGRSFVAPRATIAYQGLVMWRGLVPEREVDVEGLVGTRTRIMYLGGHGVAYLIPGFNGTVTPGERLVMWGFYLPIAGADLGRVLTDRSGHRHGSSVALGLTDDAVTASLRERLTPLIPDYYVDLLDRSEATSLQAISTVDVERTHRARSCLVGDASNVFPPFSGSGVLKAVDDVTALRSSLDEAESPSDALASWSEHQGRTAHTVRHLAKRNERALVRQVPDFTAMSATQKSNWLAALRPNDVPTSATAHTTHR